jgi:hypothetical protein
MHCQVIITSTTKHKENYLHKARRQCRRVEVFVVDEKLPSAICSGENFDDYFLGGSESEENGPQGLSRSWIVFDSSFEGGYWWG